MQSVANLELNGFSLTWLTPDNHWHTIVYLHLVAIVELHRLLHAACQFTLHWEYQILLLVYKDEILSLVDVYLWILLAWSTIVEDNELRSGFSLELQFVNRILLATVGNLCVNETHFSSWPIAKLLLMCLIMV